MAMKASMHSGRTGSARHNDRTFLRGQDNVQEIAPHIDTNKTEQNVVRQIAGRTESLEVTELKVYKKLFSASLDATNRRYRAQGHTERCKTIEELYRGRQTRPEETIYQIGNAEHSVSPQELRSCYWDYMQKILNWNEKHGRPMIILNWSLHADETTPHVHVRRVWRYKDADGNWRIGQNRALEAAGVPLPHPDRPAGRYNNRKMTFDKMSRTMWIETCRDHGIEIDDVPTQGIRHKDKQEFLTGKISKLQTELDKYHHLEERHPEDFRRMRQQEHRKTRFER